jgi:uncharacterized membrane protein YdjX (TVP38/TMEM64 family)
MTEAAPAIDRSRRRATVLVVLALASLVVIFVFRKYLDVTYAASFIQPIRDMGAAGVVAFGVITFGGVMVGLPRLFFAGLGGFLFGFVPGLLAAQLGTLAGSVVTFLYGRALGRDYVANRIGPRFHRLSAALDQVGQHGVMTNILVRNIPVGNSFVMTLAMSVTGMPIFDFALGTFLGTLPEAALCAYFCNTSGAGLGARVAVCGVIVVVLALVSWFGLRRTKLGKSLRAAKTEPPANSAPPLETVDAAR